MNLKLVKLEEKYKKQLNDMMDEWTASGEKIVPWAIIKTDYKNFEQYKNNIEILQPNEKYVPDSTFFCLDLDRNIFVGAVNIRHYLNEQLLLDGGHIGDGVRPSDGMPFGDECKGHWVITASSKADYPPEVVDQNLNPIINQSDAYSGIFARVSVSFFAYSYAGKKGIGCGLNAVQKMADGEPLGGSRMTAAEAFGDLTAAPQAAAGQPKVNPITGEIIG